MTITTCDGCGLRMDELRTGPLGDVAFKIKDFEFNAELSSARIVWNFNTTNIHICRACMLNGLLGGLTKLVTDVKMRKNTP